MFETRCRRDALLQTCKREGLWTARDEVKTDTRRTPISLPPADALGLYFKQHNKT